MNIEEPNKLPTYNILDSTNVDVRRYLFVQQITNTITTKIKIIIVRDRIKLVQTQ